MTLPHAELAVDRAMNDLTVRRLRHQHLEAVTIGEATAVEVLLHGEARAEQTDRLDLGFGNRLGGLASAMWSTGRGTAAATWS